MMTRIRSDVWITLRRSSRPSDSSSMKPCSSSGPSKISSTRLPAASISSSVRKATDGSQVIGDGAVDLDQDLLGVVDLADLDARLEGHGGRVQHADFRKVLAQVAMGVQPKGRVPCHG